MGVMMPPELTGDAVAAVERWCRWPSVVPATTIAADEPQLLFKVTVSPVAKLSVPLSVSVWPGGNWTLAPDPTLSEAPVPIVTEPRVELPLPSAIEPLPMLNAVFPFVVRLRTASLAPVEWVTVPLLVRLMTTLSDAVGTTPPTQLPGVSQSPPVGAVVVFHMIVAGAMIVNEWLVSVEVP